MTRRLDERLSAVAALVEGPVVADIGCDHGKLGYYLLCAERVGKVIATDISAQSLEKAKRLAQTACGEGEFETRQGNGLEPLISEEADTVVIAGLGGDLIARIIIDGENSGKIFYSYVLSPNTHPEKVRDALCGIGQQIVFDGMVEACGKYYTVIKSRRGEPRELDKLQRLFGTFYKTSAGFKEYAKGELEKCAKLLELNPSSAGIAKKAALLSQALGEHNEN